ncbi:hypothetical protein TOPH_03821 [Tolypocladium ophioglossoides CBS 100239]|uniref:Aminoglycoside phosphotransferase domain-containing protein n=1 Tax=Tolypocladium ophioglossoides (strain CBS 100239) TaxID=1163406 RepID=A0A0L0NCX2_TOLOC|nr:hypothetical protein TOPH_03821 [Tolypocladium ophioglossoides CBS 100239]
MPPEPTFPSAKVLAIASSLRNDGAPATLCFGTDEKPIQLGQCQISAVRFPDGETWAVRIPVHAGSTLLPSSITSIVEDEMTFMRKLNHAGFRWAPRLIGGDSSFNNALGHPYLVMTGVHGTVLNWSPEIAVAQRHKVLCQLINIQLELAECTKESRPGTSTRRYLTAIIDGKIKRVASGELPELDYRSCFMLRALARYVADDALETSLFAMSHDNLAAHKIIIDQEYNITGIIDWKFARFRPLQLALHFPRLLETDFDEADPSTSAESIHPSSTLSADRQFVMSHLSSLVANQASKGLPQLASPASIMKAVVSDPDVDWQDLVYQSCFRKNLHKWMANRSWLPYATQRTEVRLVLVDSGKTIDEEIEGFLQVADTEKGFSREKLLELCRNQEQ